ncbi:MAG TPA: pentapeptide repeat-containing protein [Candidatus Dormibacteraeota bacterium]|nr:pentapeptide repeat-containing protein [Candidatus Dormibacteraeota bacterium]
MPSLFRRLFTSQSVEERVGNALEEAAKAIAVAEPPVQESIVERTPVERVASINADSLARDERGLISADQLPSAADALAELFPSDEPPDPFGIEALSELETPQPVTETDGELETVTQREEPQASQTDPPSLLSQTEATEPSNAPEDAIQHSDPPVALQCEPDREGSTPGAEAINPAELIGLLPSIDSPADHSQSASVHTQDAQLFENPHAGSENQALEQAREAEEAEIVNAAAVASIESPASSGRDWKLEEKLASHLEWLDSHGKNGLRADLSDADLEGQELIGVKLKLADLHDANLRAADLLLADLREATLMRADMEDTCLVGANLEGANLEGASFETAMGLVPRQIAGANLRDALLPPNIMEFEAAAKFARASRIAWRCFAPIIPLALLSWLIIWKTKDAQLLTDSALIPYLHSRTAAAAIPTAQIFLLAPLVILGLYLLFQFHLQKVWDAALELPAIFPDGHPLDDRGPEIIVGLLRAHFWWINRERSATQWVEKTISVLLAYWAVPFTLALYWARYLTMQDPKGTLLQTLIVTVAAGVALHATLKTGPKRLRWASKPKWISRVAGRFGEVSPPVLASVLGAALVFLSIGTIAGVPHEHSRAPQYSRASIRRWAADVFWTVGFDPYADITEAALSRETPNWTAANSQIASVKGPLLNEAKFRYAQAYGVFLANAHLWQSDFEGAYLSEADLRGADLGHSNLHNAILDGALLSGANLNRARLDGAMLARADLRWANLSYASLIHATLVDTRLDGATLYDAQLISASLARSDLEKADLRGSSLNAADLDHADLQQALLWSANLPGANLYGAKLQGAVAIGADLRGADLREARFGGTVMSDANLSGSNLDRADLSGALELTASQVCSSKSRRGALLDPALAAQVTSECGGL